MKPIRVFYSELSGNFYASRSYKVAKTGRVTITGAKDDVTQDIARAIVEHGVRFRPVKAEADAAYRDAKGEK